MKSYFKFIAICLIHISYKVTGQQIEKYRFVVKNKIIVDTVTKNYVNAELEFSYTRTPNADGSFNEQGLFERGEAFVTFKKVASQDWFVKNKGKWDLFFTKSKAISPVINIDGEIIKLLRIKRSSLYGLTCILYKASFVNKIVGGDLVYGFNPEKGIILIQADGVELIRSDVLPRL